MYKEDHLPLCLFGKWETCARVEIAPPEDSAALEIRKCFSQTFDLFLTSNSKQSFER